MGQDQPWSEKIPGVTGQGSDADAAALRASMQSMLQDVMKFAQGQPQAPAATQILPGQIPPIPGSTISFSPGGSGAPFGHAGARLGTPAPVQTGSQSIGHFANRGEATNAGMVSLGNTLSQMFGRAEEKAQNKKAAEAENYMLQISQLATSPDPKDREKAQMFIDDPKIRKILKEGIGYVPLEEKPPPEAQGVQAAVQKMTASKGAPRQGMPQPQPQQGHAILPRMSTQQQVQNATWQAIANKIQKDPEWALSLVGAPQLSSWEQHFAERYKSELEMTPAQVESMNMTQKLAGLKLIDNAINHFTRAEAEIYKAQKGAISREEVARIQAGAKDRFTEAYKEVNREHDKAHKMSGEDSLHLGAARVYGQEAGKYLDLIKSGKNEKGLPYTDAQKDMYQREANRLLEMSQTEMETIGLGDSQQALEDLIKAGRPYDEDPEEELRREAEEEP